MIGLLPHSMLQNRMPPRSAPVFSSYSGRNSVFLNSVYSHSSLWYPLCTYRNDAPFACAQYAVLFTAWSKSLPSISFVSSTVTIFPSSFCTFFFPAKEMPLPRE